MTLIRDSIKAASLMTALALLGSAIVPLGTAAECRQTVALNTTTSWAIVCENRAGKISCYIQQ